MIAQLWAGEIPAGNALEVDTKEGPLSLMSHGQRRAYYVCETFGLDRA